MVTHAPTGSTGGAHGTAGRRNAAIFAATVATVVVLFLFPASTDRVGATHRPGQAAPVGVVAAPTPSTSAGSGGATPSPGAATTTVNGASVDTRYGPVQVQIQVQGSKIVSATAIDYPQSGGRDREINSFAIPLLQSETTAAQSAQIDTVSGATYTSQGYIGSLQSALDAAHLG